MQKILVLSKNDIEKLVDMKELIENMKDAYKMLSSNEAKIPNRIHLTSTKHQSTALFMPFYADKINSFGFKFVCVSSSNPKNGLPLIHGFVTLIDAQTGKLLSIMEGSSLTAYRTAAGSGAAVDIFAKEDTKTAAVFGSGAQAETQLEAICSKREINTIYAYAQNAEKLQKFAQKMSKKIEYRGYSNL